MSDCKTSTQPLLPSAAPLCALSAHTLHKAGEVLTEPGQAKQTLERKETDAKPISQNALRLTGATPRSGPFYQTFVLPDRDCASEVSTEKLHFYLEGIIPPLPQPYGRYHNTICRSNCQYFLSEFLCFLLYKYVACVREAKNR